MELRHIRYFLAVAEGTYVRQDGVRISYSLSHNGILDFVRGQPHVYSYAEKVVPGHAWMFAFQTSPLNYSRERRAITTAVRTAVIAEERE